MKSTKHLLLIILTLISINVYAQETPTVTINVETAGTLPSLIPSSQKNEIKNLTLTGFLNGTDIRFIREMAGRDYNGNSTVGKLSVLDLSKAQIVAGGLPYYVSDTEYYSSSNNIGDYVFEKCTELTSITIPNSVTTIGEAAFYRCTGLTSITISNSVTTIGDYAFEKCTGLRSANIPNGVRSICGTFCDCTGLTSVTIPNGVTTIGGGTFSGCIGLTSVTIPNSVTTIAYDAFEHCTGLTSITIPNSVTIIGNGSFEGCTGLTSVTIPNSVTTIGEAAFSSCTGLTSITIPNSVTTIEYSTFSDCTGLTSVTIPSSLKTIGGYAFYDCTRIKQLYCQGTTPPKVDSNTFSDIYNTCELYVPKESYSAYQADPHWGKFTNIIEQVTTSISDIEASKTNVYTENGSIIVKGGKLGDTVDIYSVSGSLLHKIKITDDIVRINVAPQSLYIVKTGDKSFKIAL